MVVSDGVLTLPGAMLGHNVEPAGRAPQCLLSGVKRTSAVKDTDRFWLRGHWSADAVSSADPLWVLS
jgi:hypothetical protein